MANSVDRLQHSTDESMIVPDSSDVNKSLFAMSLASGFIIDVRVSGFERICSVHIADVRLGRLGLE